MVIRVSFTWVSPESSQIGTNWNFLGPLPTHSYLGLLLRLAFLPVISLLPFLAFLLNCLFFKDSPSPHLCLVKGSLSRGMSSILR